MRRVVLLCFLVVGVIVWTGTAGSATRRYTDPQENWTYALDMTVFDVSDDASNFVIDIFTPNYQGITSGDTLTVYLNTDRNRSNNDGGAEYALYIEGATPSCGLFHWNGSAYVLVRSLSCPVNYGPTFTFSRADVGSPPDFEFFARSHWTPPPGVEESDRAPDSGWWLYDPTPPETTITGGPSGSTPDRNASLTFSSNEGGSTFQCSLDGAGFSGCGSPANYSNLAYGAHTFQVRATDPSGNTDASPAVRSWTVVDATPPTVRAVTGTCCVKGKAEIRYTIGDNTGTAAAQVTLQQVGRSRPAKTCSFGLGLAQPTTYVARCLVPSRARGWLKYCVVATDAASLHSPASCGRVTFARLYARPVYAYTRIGSSNAVRLTAWSLANLGGGHASIRCSGCRFRGRGTTLPKGARIEVRVIKPRIRGSFIRLTGTGSGIQRDRDRCLPPGLPGPVVSCLKKS
jgi:hypothetical protein